MNDKQFLAAYQKLNAKQKEAVDTIDGPLLVIAGPGTGKTQLLALRVANILRTREVSPHNILCLTFTDNGAVNMRERLTSIIGSDAYRVGIYTFHSFANNIIARFPEYFYNAATFTQASDLERAEIVTEIFSSLPHKHPLGSFHPSEGYVYLRDTIDRIKHIKSGGYTPLEYSALVETFTKEYPAINTILKDWPEGRMGIKRLSEYAAIQKRLSLLDTTTAILLATTLNEALRLSSVANKTEPLSDWKKSYTVTEEESVVLKDSYQLEKIRAVAEIYTLYTEALHNKGLYDYDDVIIEVTHALKNNSTLCNSIEEQYQYILIDEFQDTNEAQMNLVRAISSSFVHEGMPNVMAVGDDDQAIYKFQGAEISNLIDFRDRTYQNVATVILDTNYRSHQHILDLSRSIVTQGVHRLETRFKDVGKTLTQGNSALTQSNISIVEYGSDIEEYTHIAKSIADKIAHGEAPEEITVLARNHRELKAFLPFLDQAHVPYEYVKKANVFDEPHIQELLTICEYVSSVTNSESRKDELLPTILCFPYFHIARPTLFDIAVAAKEQHASWVSVMHKHDDAHVVRAHELLAQFVAKAIELPLEHFLEQYMEESGFKEHYFNNKILKTTPTTYIHFLASLKTFIEAMREWREGEVLFAHDVAPFVSMHREHNLSLISESPFIKNEHSVRLLTAHAAKGLEFGSVYIIAAHDELWTKSARTNKSPLPTALAPLLVPAGDTEDDFIRLFYVAVTRAKHTLTISGHKSLVRYVGEHATKDTTDFSHAPLTAHENALAIVSAPYQESEWAILKRLVEGYRMPVTHMSNFLNITEGGPLYFIEQNLLRFPQPMNISGVFGSAIHKAIAELVMYPKYNAGEIPPLTHILSIFKRDLSKGRLGRNEQAKQEKRGIEVLTKYYEQRAKYFDSNDQIEVDMKNEGATIMDAVLTGKLDFLRQRNGAYEVIDFKTGRTYEDWDLPKLTDNDKIKLHKFKQQLIYYKLLLEHSSLYTQPVGTLAIEFVESVLDYPEPVTITYDPTPDEVLYVKKLIQAVYKCITTLNFPDIAQYEQNYKGILAFEQDLISGEYT